MAKVEAKTRKSVRPAKTSTSHRNTAKTAVTKQAKPKSRSKPRNTPRNPVVEKPSSLSASIAKAEPTQQLANVARQLRTWSDTAIGLVGPVADMSLKMATTKMKSSGNSAPVRKAGALIDRAREAAGLTVQDVSQAVNLRDKDLIEQAEGGKIRLSFEVILRLASVYGRHDPMSFIMKITRVSNPELWKMMENLGVGKLAVQSAREREFVNIYRSSDAARKLSETEFTAVLKLVNAAFEMALAFMQTVSTEQRS
jgi:transcriptional regulator with XRE-family HTH domain